jgi:DNA-binding PadR family transcriptional regulator
MGDLKTIRQLRADGLIDRTLPDKPQSRLQKYRLTDKGRACLKAREEPAKDKS